MRKGIKDIKVWLIRPRRSYRRFRYRPHNPIRRYRGYFQRMGEIFPNHLRDSVQKRCGYLSSSIKGEKFLFKELSIFIECKKGRNQNLSREAIRENPPLSNCS
jgi:hypothetical protein